HIKSTAGQASVDGSAVTVNVGDLAPGSKATIEIPVSVSADAASHISNQASATYGGATDAIQSNAFIAQVAAPASGPASPQQQPAQAPQGSQANPPAKQAESQPAAPQPAPQDKAKEAPAGNTQAAQPNKAQAAQPNTQ